MKDLVGKNELIDLLCVRHLSRNDTAKTLNINPTTVTRYAKHYGIDARLWWKYQRIFCPECGVEIDPNVELPEAKRKALIKKGHVLCEDCKVNDRKKKDRDAKREKRDANREEYNKYQRELMRKRYAERKKNGDGRQEPTS